MATFSIKPSKHGRASIKYVTEEKSHREDMDRVLEISGVNCLPETALDSFSKVWDRFNVNEAENVQTYNAIQSFSREEFIVDNPDDVKKVHEIGLETGQRLFPGRQVLVVTQADTENAVLHNHIVINNANPVDGKKLSGAENRWINLQPKHDEILLEFGANVIDLSKDKAIDRRTISEIKTAEKGKYVWKDDLRDRILESLANPEVVTMQKFKEDMLLNYRVDVRERNNGNLSYYFIDEDFKQRKIRAIKLGSLYAKEKINAAIQLNQQEQPANKVKTPETTKKQPSQPVNDIPIKRTTVKDKTPTQEELDEIMNNLIDEEPKTIITEEPKKKEVKKQEIKSEIKPKQPPKQPIEELEDEEEENNKKTVKPIPLHEVEKIDQQKYKQAREESKFKNSTEYKVLKQLEEEAKKAQHD